VPLDENRVCDLYDLRELLEPKAMASSAGRVPREFLAGMAERLEAAIAAYPKVSATDMDALEHGLHVTCLGYCGNLEIMEALKRTRCLHFTQKHMLGAQISYPADEPFMTEHLDIVRAMLRNDPAQIEAKMLAHLRTARAKVIDRLAVFRRSFGGSDLPYIG
jgi:DNA-binding GntR family transcriptional regulator